eukprot:evm.model.NODE_51261_length_21574_cov_29.278948.3
MAQQQWHWHLPPLACLLVACLVVLLLPNPTTAFAPQLNGLERATSSSSFTSTTTAPLPSSTRTCLFAAVSTASSSLESRRKGGNFDLELFSPAKINLFLRIIRRREDGYHELASLFQTVAFGDTLLFKALPVSATQDEFASSFTSLVTDKSNLVLRALDLFRRKTGKTQHFQVYLEKRTPVQAGLGGGSSNAATTLFAANKLLGCPASDEDLIEWSKELGSDITFFLSQGTAYCTGRGEILEPVPALSPSTHLYIVKPPIGLSTPAVFKALDLNALSKEDPRALLSAFTTRLGKGEPIPPSLYVNDLEPPAFQCIPRLKTIKDSLLSKGFTSVMMSGSGTSIFAMAPPSLPPSFDAAAFAKEMDVDVWATTFTGRPKNDPKAWYPNPHA